MSAPNVVDSPSTALPSPESIGGPPSMGTLLANGLRSLRLESERLTRIDAVKDLRATLAATILPVVMRSQDRAVIDAEIEEDVEIALEFADEILKQVLGESKL